MNNGTKHEAQGLEPQQSALAGYVMVPVEPNEALLDAMWNNVQQEPEDSQLKVLYKAILAAAPKADVQDEVPCSTHPDAPHGFNRNSSHSLDRYVCDCEGWVPPAQEAVKHDIKGSRKALGAMNAKLKAKIGRLERELAAPQPSNDAKDAYLRGLKDQKATFEKAYLSTSCYVMCENKTSDGLRAMDAAIDAAMAGGGE